MGSKAGARIASNVTAQTYLGLGQQTAIQPVLAVAECGPSGAIVGTNLPFAGTFHATVPDLVGKMRASVLSREPVWFSSLDELWARLKDGGGGATMMQQHALQGQLRWQYGLAGGRPPQKDV